MGIAGTTLYQHVFSSAYTNKNPGYIHTLAGFPFPGLVLCLTPRHAILQGRHCLKDIRKPSPAVCYESQCNRNIPLSWNIFIKGLVLWDEIHSILQIIDDNS